MGKKKTFLLILLLLDAVFGRQLVSDVKPYVLFADVGQGDAEMVRTSSGTTVLVDGGPTAKVSEVLGRRMPYFQRKIDLLVLSHAHADHLVGQIDVLERYDVGLVVWNGAAKDSSEFWEWFGLIREKGIPLRKVGAGDYVDLGSGIGLEVLWPEKESVQEDLNLGSLVFRLVGGKETFLFTGDVDAETLGSLDSLEASVLKVPHHGSRTGLDPLVLEEIGPDSAVVEVGENSYGHPSQSTLRLLKEAGAVTYSTREGNVFFSLE